MNFRSLPQCSEMHNRKSRLVVSMADSKTSDIDLSCPLIIYGNLSKLTSGLVGYLANDTSQYVSNAAVKIFPETQHQIRTQAPSSPAITTSSPFYVLQERFKFSAILASLSQFIFLGKLRFQIVPILTLLNEV